MPDREVETIRDLIYYQYAKIIAKSSLGPDAKKESYGFIKTTFRDLKFGRKSWSDITREDKQLVNAPKECAYCSATAELSWDHIVPKSIRITERCSTCDRIQSIHNQVWACKACNSQKHTSGLYSFYSHKFTGDSKYYDHIPALTEKKYLKTIYACHECAGTLDRGDLDGDGKLTVLDLDWVLFNHRAAATP